LAASRAQVSDFSTTRTGMRVARHAGVRLGLALIVAVAACGPPPRAADARVVAHETLDVTIAPNPQLDVLFVIDNSGSMLEEQQTLARSFSAFADALGQLPGGLPDLHLGVVSSDMGTLEIPTGDPACSDSDQGHLLKGDPDLGNQCLQVNGNYLVDVDDGAGGRATNFTGTLADAFGCIAAIGKNGCGFEQHLASMKAALDDNPVNTDFLRSDALLAVVVIADEDDCSAADPAFFGAETLELGPIDSFRCFEKAVACTEGRDVDLRVAGIKTGCHVDETQTYLHHVAEYVDFLRGLKSDPEDVVVVGITGDPEPVEVGTRMPMGGTMPRADLVPSCAYTTIDGATNTADPAIRLRTFLDGFPHRNAASTVCAADYTSAFVRAGALIRRMNEPCFEEAIAQPADCDVALVSGTTTPLGQCDAAITSRPCWHLVADPRCADTPTGLAIVVESDAPLTPETHVHATCRIE
jgi:hypothetical protein